MALTKPQYLTKTLYDLYQELGLPLDLINQDIGFTVFNLKDTITELPYTSPPFRPDYFSFIFVKDAHGKYSIDEHNFLIEPGTIYFTNPGNYRTFEWTNINEAYLITFSEDYLRENVHQDVFEDFSFLLTETIQPRVLSMDIFNDMEKLYFYIHKEYWGTSTFKNRIIGNLFVVLLLKIKEYFFKDYDPIYEGNRGSQIVKIFKLNLENHYRDLFNGRADKIFRANDYADLQHLHPNYLGNVIKSKTGKTISTWLAEKTISEAKSLLQNSAMSIKEVAYFLKFTESTHFSNYFKKYTSQSPADYRKTHNSSQS